MKSNNMTRYQTLREAFQKEGILFMSIERLFYWMGMFTLPPFFRIDIAKRVLGIAVPKHKVNVKDGYRLIFYALFLIIIPIGLVFFNFNLAEYSIFGYFSVYVIFSIFQWHINVLFFDKFRGEKLPICKAERRWLKILISINGCLDCILPLDTQDKCVNKHYLSGELRKMIIFILDFIVIFVAFSYLYLSLFPVDFNTSISKFGDAFYFSVITGTTLGYGDFLPLSQSLKFVAATQTLLCVLFSIIILAYSVSFLPKLYEHDK